MSRHCTRPYRRWSAAEAVTATRTWAAAHGRPPQTHDFAHDPALPPIATLQKLGFTVRTLRLAADLDPTTRRRQPPRLREGMAQPRQ